MQEILSTADEMQLILVQPDDQRYPIRFQSVCQRCGLLVAETVYTEELEADPASEERLERDGEQDSAVAMGHRCHVGMA